MSLLPSLPELAGLSEARVREIQDGSPFSAAEFESLCRALAVDSVAMHRGEENRPNRAPARFRGAISDGRVNGRDMRLLSLAVEQSRILGHLLKRLGRGVPLARYREVRPPSQNRDVWREGYEFGESARAALLPLPGPIFDLEAAARGLGIHVAQVTFSTPDIDAASVWDPTAVPVILLNKKSSRHRHTGALRATIAHELCHLLHDAGEQDLTTQVSWGRGRRGNFNEAVEVRARAFAPAFLAPRDQTRAWLQGQPSRIQNSPDGVLVALAEHWGLSLEGAAWHARNCELLELAEAEAQATTSSRRRISLHNFESSRGTTPPAMIFDDLPDHAAELWEGWATDLVLAAVEEGQISVGRARELLTWA
ncbi:MAG: ImmA/IrrE family metallo-endopeptidase [Myxococcota bacterium]